MQKSDKNDPNFSLGLVLAKAVLVFWEYLMLLE